MTQLRDLLTDTPVVEVPYAYEDVDVAIAAAASAIQHHPHPDDERAGITIGLLCAVLLSTTRHPDSRRRLWSILRHATAYEALVDDLSSGRF